MASGLTKALDLPAEIRSRVISGVNGLDMHVLEAGFNSSSKTKPCVLLLHGFPELAYSWRKVMPALAQAGYYVIAPDQRGYGGTTGWDANYNTSLTPYGPNNLVTDQLALLRALGIEQVHAVVGHDFGSRVAGWCALTRPDVFRSVVMMSSPFTGAPELPEGIDGTIAVRKSAFESVNDVVAQLSTLDKPRKHYQWYYSGPEANADMQFAKQGLHSFLRAYYHSKSADWVGNKPYPLPAFSAATLALLPTYYVMDADQNMAQTAALYMPDEEHIAKCQWLTEAELSVYTQNYQRTGFQGGLHWYRCGTDASCQAALNLFSGKTIDVPSAFISGQSDWGTYQFPGAFEKMQNQTCTQMTMCELVPNAGHWVQQEQAESVSNLLIKFLNRAV